MIRKEKMVLEHLYVQRVNYKHDQDQGVGKTYLDLRPRESEADVGVMFWVRVEARAEAG